MKKILYTFFVFICCTIFLEQSFAEPRECMTGDYCAIQNDTNADLQIYIDSNKKVVQNLTRIVRSEGTRGEATDGLQYFGKYVVGGLNKSVDWRRFDNLYDFYITSAMEGSLPTPVYRDYQKIVEEGERIQRLINMMSDQLYNDIEITNGQVCDGVSTKCTLYDAPIGGLISGVLVDLQENNNRVKDIFRLSVTGKENKTSITGQSYLFLINTSISGISDRTATSYFENQIEENYGANAIAECNQCSGGSFEQVSKSLKSLASTLKGQTSSYKSWKDSWYLLIGATEQSRKIENERALLQKELFRQGVQTKNVDIMLQNLDEYNNPENEDGRVGGFTWGNNFISNSYNSFINDTKSDLNKFDSTIDSAFSEKYEEPGVLNESEFITLEEFSAAKDKIDVSVLIGQEIDELYKKQLENAQKDDLETSKLSGRIIETHNNLVEAIKILEKVIPISEEVCDSQASGLGTCSYGNHK